MDDFNIDQIQRPNKLSGSELINNAFQPERLLEGLPEMKVREFVDFYLRAE